MKCHFCPAILGVRYVMLIGPKSEHVFNICWECWQRTSTSDSAYHPSIHDDGPPVEVSP